MIRRHWQKALALVLWLSVLAAYAFWSYSSGMGPMQGLRKVGGVVAGSPWGPALYIAMYIVRPLLLFPAALLTVAGGAFFGLSWGLLYTLIGSNLGASLAYLLGRYLGTDTTVQKESSQESQAGLARYAQGMRERSFETVFLLRLMFVPYDLVNYAAGFLKIRYWPFLVATALGSLPGTLSFVLFGASAGLDKGTPSFDPRVLLASVAIFGVSLAVSRKIKKREQTDA